MLTNDDAAAREGARRRRPPASRAAVHEAAAVDPHHHRQRRRRARRRRPHVEIEAVLASAGVPSGRRVAAERLLHAVGGVLVGVRARRPRRDAAAAPSSAARRPAAPRTGCPCRRRRRRPPRPSPARRRSSRAPSPACVWATAAAQLPPAAPWRCRARIDVHSLKHAGTLLAPGAIVNTSCHPSGRRAIIPAVEPNGLSLQERKQELVRAELFNAAWQLFGERGYEATTVAEIAAAAGVSRRTFFRYYASKEDVLVETSDELAEAMLAAMAERPLDEPPLRRHRARAGPRAREPDGAAPTGCTRSSACCARAGRCAGRCSSATR